MTLCLVVAASCTPSKPVAHRAGQSPVPVLTGSLQVFADSSLQPAFDALITAFVGQHPGLHMGPPSYQGSQALATAILHGASADVFASSDPAVMAELAAGGRVATGTARTFARDPLQIMVKGPNPKGIQSLADLARPGVVVVLPNPSLPSGAAAAQALARAGVSLPGATVDLNLNAIVAGVTSGLTDATILARSAVVAAGPAATGIDIPPGQDVTTTESIAAVAHSPDATAAAAFIAFVLSPSGQAILQTAGFSPPP